VIKENNIIMSGGQPQPTNMMGRRLADQNPSQGVGSQPSGSFSNNVNDPNSIMGLSGGMTRLKGNSPKVSTKD